VSVFRKIQDLCLNELGARKGILPVRLLNGTVRHLISKTPKHRWFCPLKYCIDLFERHAHAVHVSLPGAPCAVTANVKQIAVVVESAACHLATSPVILIISAFESPKIPILVEYKFP
jgi:hypothetical protein